MNKAPGLLAALAMVAVCAGCDDDPVADAVDAAAPDAAIDLPDAAAADAAAPPVDAQAPDPPLTSTTCESAHEVVGIIGTVEVSGDTTDAPPGGLDLGESCAVRDAFFASPQVVVAYRVPGEGPHAVSFTLATRDTLTNFDTVIQVRRECSTIPEGGFPPSCFDDQSRDEIRSAGTVTATGGETLYLVVTGFAESPATDAIDRGPFALEITARTNETPALEGGEVRVVAERTEIEASGTDADGDVLGVAFSFLDGEGQAVDLDGDGEVGDTLLVGFDADLAGMNPFVGVATAYVIAVRGAGAFLSQRLVDLGVTDATLTVFDDAFAMSEPLVVPVRVLEEVGLDAACGGAQSCTLGLVCEGGRCAASPPLAAACATATAIAFDPLPETTRVSVSTTGTLEPGHGVFDSTCAHSPGDEAMFDITVPDGAFDLLATTDLEGTGMTDTVLFVRSACPDRLSETACNDDIAPEGQNIRSRVALRDVSAGTHTLFVGTFGHPSEVAVPFEVEVSLRPVLDVGAACDPGGVDNRCAGAPCSGETSVCP